VVVAMVVMATKLTRTNETISARVAVDGGGDENDDANADNDDSTFEGRVSLLEVPEVHSLAKPVQPT